MTAILAQCPLLVKQGLLGPEARLWYTCSSWKGFLKHGSIFLQ
jgi:hypothetical protein